MNEPWWTQRLHTGILIISILFTGFGIYGLQDSFVIKSRLIE